MRRWIVHWSVQDPETMPPWPVCAGHRDAVAVPMLDPEVVALAATQGSSLQVTEVGSGVCALAAFGNCCDDPVSETPSLDVRHLDREEL